MTYSFEIRSTKFRNEEPFVIVSSRPYYIWKKSRMVNSRVMSQYYDYYNAITKRHDPIPFDLARVVRIDEVTSEKKDSIPYNDIQVPGVVIESYRPANESEVVAAPVINASKFKGMLRTAAALLFTANLPLLDPRVMNYYAKGGRKSKKDKNASTSATAITKQDLDNIRLRYPIIGLFGAMDDTGNIGSRVWVENVKLAYIPDLPPIEAYDNNRADAADDELLSPKISDAILDQNMSQKQIPMFCQVREGCDWTHKIRVNNLTLIELGLLLRSLEYVRKTRMPVGSKKTLGKTGSLDFEYDFYPIDSEHNIDEDARQSLSDALAESQGLFADALKAFDDYIQSRNPQTTATLTYVSDQEPPKKVGRKKRKSIDDESNEVSEEKEEALC